MKWYAIDPVSSRALYHAPTLNALVDRTRLILDRPPATIVRRKTNVGGQYDLYCDERILAHAIRIDPDKQGLHAFPLVPQYPSEAVPRYRLHPRDIEDIVRVWIDGTIGDEPRFGGNVPLILGLASIGKSNLWIAQALKTSLPYVKRVVTDPKPYLYVEEVNGKVKEEVR